ncbi:type II restriction endonuclease EcoO109I-like protein [Balneicella halophila]|uniref:Type II restriction endonuclease EcoO109I-like protein n=1 Tax=Balneicella halophila TaxID=1537566 RepID=A0A7L4UQU2_BALHA|nr:MULTISPECIES: PmeII family type II restriction endonuclease [Bacteroidota]MDH7914644.1 PmeII family type II restriction endonuclease [Winogradskyella sp. SYSU M77433]PVX50110.1 type II restriction endonuclease EcoO109I-like protein [Balneicella halophila]
MNQLNLTDVTQYVEENIGTFHQKRIERLNKLKLKTVLKKKNPYLFKAKHLLTANEIVQGIADAYISSGEETIFGDWLEGLAIFINQKVYGGWKSGIPNIDLEFDKDNARYIVNIKSGPNWGNSSQISKMKSDFKTAQRTLRTSNSNLMVVSINGCCYGIDNRPDKGDYFKYCGQEFWEFVSGNSDLYTEIIEPLGHKSKERNDEFMESYSNMINKFTRDFIKDFCKSNGEIDWIKLVEFNSGKKK